MVEPLERRRARRQVRVDFLDDYRALLVGECGQHRSIRSDDRTAASSWAAPHKVRVLMDRIADDYPGSCSGGPRPVANQGQFAATVVTTVAIIVKGHNSEGGTLDHSALVFSLPGNDTGLGRRSRRP